MTSGRLQIDALPTSWEQGPEPGWFRATAVPAKGAAWSRVRAFEPLERNPNYLLDRVGARVEGPLGRPAVASLPESLADGIAVVGYDNLSTGMLEFLGPALGNEQHEFTGRKFNRTRHRDAPRLLVVRFRIARQRRRLID